MSTVSVSLPVDSAKELYRFLHHGEGQQNFPELYAQLQTYFFQVLTISEIQRLLGDES